MSWLGVMIDNITGDNDFFLKYPMPKCSMVLEYLPTFTLKITQLCTMWAPPVMFVGLDSPQ